MPILGKYLDTIASIYKKQSVDINRRELKSILGTCTIEGLCEYNGGEVMVFEDGIADVPGFELSDYGKEVLKKEGLL